MLAAASPRSGEGDLAATSGAARPTHAVSATEAAAPEAPPRPAVDVLVVDDDEAVRVSCATMLRVSGLSVAVAEDGDEALAALRDVEVAVVLLDVNAPPGRRLGPRGPRRATARRPHVGLSLRQGTAGSVGSKVVMHLEKPVPPHRLVPVVAGIVWGSS